MNTSPAKEKRAWPFFVMCALVAVYCTGLLQLTLKQAFPLWLTLAGSACLFAVLLLVSRKTGPLHLTVSTVPEPFPLRTFLLAFLFSSCVRLVFLLAYFPGGASSDTLIQWQQLRIFEFDDWHPALHTLVLWALTRIIYHPAFLLIVQDLCFSLSVAYTASVLKRWNFPKCAILLTIGYLTLSPATANLMTFIWKDCAYATFILLLATQILQIHFSEGRWLSRLPNQIAFGFVLSICSILRHNGFAATLPVIVWLLISLSGQRKRLLVSLITCVILYAGIRGPLYSAFHVRPAERRLEETYGVPITILTHVYAKSPESLDEETTTFLSLIAPQEVFAEYDTPGDWNEIKWHVSPEDLSDYSLIQVFRFAARAFAKEPALSMEALSGLWRMPLQPFGSAYWRMSPYLESDESTAYTGFTFRMTGNAFMRRVLNALCRYSASPAFSWLFWNPGFAVLLVMLLCTLFAWHRRLSALTIPALIIAYTFATALVLSSPTDFRFFLSIPLAAPLAVLNLIASNDPAAQAERRLPSSSKQS